MSDEAGGVCHQFDRVLCGGLPEVVNQTDVAPVWRAGARKKVDQHCTNSHVELKVSGKQPVQLGNHNGVGRISISPDGQYVATSPWHGHGIRVWGSRTGELVQDLVPERRGEHVAFSPNGKWLLASLPAGELIAETATWTIREIPGSVNDGGEKPVAFSPDSRLAVVPHSDFIFRLTEPETATVVAVHEASNSVSGRPTLSPSGDRILVSVKGGIDIWDLQTLRAELNEFGLDW